MDGGLSKDSNYKKIKCIERKRLIKNVFVYFFTLDRFSVSTVLYVGPLTVTGPELVVGWYWEVGSSPLSTVLAVTTNSSPPLLESSVAVASGSWKEKVYY